VDNEEREGSYYNSHSDEKTEMSIEEYLAAIASIAPGSLVINEPLDALQQQAWREAEQRAHESIAERDHIRDHEYTEITVPSSQFFIRTP
jgi:hypothetical protein